MKKVLSVLSVLAAVVAVALFTFAGHSHAGVALAMGIPIMPRFMGRRALNRDIALNQGTFGIGGEDLTYPLYDRMKLLASLGTAARVLFNTSVGGQRETLTLTYADTNVQQSGQVPTSQKWIFNSLEVKWQSHALMADATEQLFLNYVRTTSFYLKINSKDAMFIVPLWMFFGPTQGISQPAATINTRAPMGMFGGVWEFDPELPIVLQAQTNWSLVVEPQVASDGALDADYIGFVFKGRRARAD